MGDPLAVNPHLPANDSRRIVVVGPCASGKSTLVAALRARGYDAHASGQEHSIIAALWRNLDPDVLVALAADIAAVRQRRGYDWPEWLHDLQVQRLHHAIAAADLRIDTSRLDAATVTDQVVAFLASNPGAGCSRTSRADGGGTAAPVPEIEPRPCVIAPDERQG